MSVWSKGMYSNSNICLDDYTAEHLPSFQPDPVLSKSDVSGSSLTLHIENEHAKMLPESTYYNSDDALSSLISRHVSRAVSSSCGHYDWNLDSGHQAKRARVENIIKGMTSSPVAHCTDLMTSETEKADNVQDKEKFQELLLTQDRNGSGSISQTELRRKQLESQHHHFRQLRTRINSVDGVTEMIDGDDKKKSPTWENNPETSPDKDECSDSCSEFESGSSGKYQGWKKVKLMNYFQSKPERIKLMADVLKYELSKAVSRSVDSIFKNMPLLSPNDEGRAETDVPLHSVGCNDNKFSLLRCGNREVQLPGVQTEALSLVVQKPRLDRGNKLVLPSRSRTHHRLKPPTTISYDSATCEGEMSEKNDDAISQNSLPFLPDGYGEVGQAEFEVFDTDWNAVKVRSKVNSRSVRSPQTRTVSVDPILLQSLCLPHVKIESDSLMKNNLYMLNEGLTTSHLKKAKLMFFYTRYPSSLVLKMCFHDVQFTRCITSQLIKWFSNFREFYYIQMEKFARHALLEGVADVRGLTVGRESELFRALNVHYNKANEFQVPDRFLEVAEITLREFYIAISMGKDRDPSWKKAIYKVICKLDSDVPAEFKSHHSG